MSGFREVCRLVDLVPNRASRVVVEGVAVALVRTDDDVFAIDDRCSHADVALSAGEVEGCTIECWLHGSAFDLRTGVPSSPPATVPVPVYPVRVTGEGDLAVVELDPTPIPVTELRNHA